MAGEPRMVTADSLAAPGGHYSHAVVAGGLVFVSGQLPITPLGVKLADSPFAEQARQVLANVTAALVAAGSGIDRLVQVRAYVTEIADWPEFNLLYSEWAGGARPARAVVPVPALRHGFNIEVEAVALPGLPS
jgi:reactive intermediate/imine deaminase